MKTRSILIITYWSYAEPLIQTYTLPYVRIIQSYLPEGSKIYLVTLEKNHLKTDDTSKSRIKTELAASGIQWLPFTYYNFGLRAVLNWGIIFFRLLFLLMRSKSPTLHCWCTPAGAAGYFLSLVTGLPLVLDSYEPHAEAMVENDTWKKDSLAFRILFWLEKKQSEKASFIVSCTEGMRHYAKQKYNLTVRNFFVKPACVDLNLFTPDKSKNPQLIDRLGLQNKIVCVYAGKLGGIYLDREVFDFLKVAYEHWKDDFRVVLMTSHTEQEIRTFCSQASLDFSIFIIVHIEHSRIPEYIGLGDFALTPVKPVPTKKFCTPIKDGEYWAMGLPVIIPHDISDDSAIIEEHVAGVVMKNFTREEYQRVVRVMESILTKPREENFLRIRKLAEQFRSFSIARQVYAEVYRTDFK